MGRQSLVVLGKVRRLRGLSLGVYITKSYTSIPRKMRAVPLYRV